MLMERSGLVAVYNSTYISYILSKSLYMKTELPLCWDAYWNKSESILIFPSIRAASQHLARYTDTGVVRIQVYWEYK